MYICKKVNTYVKDREPDADCEELHFEIAAIHLEKINTIVVAIYWSPDGDLNIFFNKLTMFLESLTSKYEKKNISLYLEIIT